MRDDNISIANSHMTITAACREAGVDIPDFGASSIKTYCPFGEVMHNDGGTSKAFRVYPDTNTAYCFAGCGRYTPVTLLAASKDISPEEAAEMILERVGYVQPSYEDRWKALMGSVGVDREGLAEALRVACSAMTPKWELAQFEDRVADTFRKCADILPRIHDEDAARTWLTKSKQVMFHVLGDFK